MSNADQIWLAEQASSERAEARRLFIALQQIYKISTGAITPGMVDPLVRIGQIAAQALGVPRA